jgi:hypothetical protein
VSLWPPRGALLNGLLQQRQRIGHSPAQGIRQVQGALGNLLPKELSNFILERIASGACQTPTDVVCAAMPH